MKQCFNGVFIILISLVLFIVGCRTNNYNNSYSITYPYYASKVRENTIRSNWEKIKKGMSNDEVIKLLGKPDRILPSYEPKIYKPKQIGYTYWYIIQLKCKNGSMYDKDEKSFRVSFNLNYKVISTYFLDFDKIKNR